MLLPAPDDRDVAGEEAASHVRVATADAVPLPILTNEDAATGVLLAAPCLSGPLLIPPLGWNVGLDTPTET